MSAKSFVPKTLIFLLILVVGITAGTLIVASASNMVNRSFAPAPIYQTNASGETYGSLSNASAVGSEPDLIKALGVDGKTIGYIRNTDLNRASDLPKTPQEALAIQAKQSGPRRIPLYDVDGKTIIGEYEIEPGTVDYGTAAQ